MAADRVVLGGADLEVEVVPGLGGRLSRIRAFGRELLRTDLDPVDRRDDPIIWGAYPMAPWCNRIAAVPTPFAGRVIDLAPTYRDGTAIHGQVATAPWQVLGPGRLRIEGGGAATGWPWRFAIDETVTVGGGPVPRLDLALALTNLDPDAAMPAGIGLHPWFRTPIEVRLGAAAAVSNVEPGAVLAPVAGTRRDLRAGGPLPEGLDDTWADVDDGAIELAWPNLGIEAALRLRADAGRHVAIASPPGEDAVAIEPQTHLPDGLRRRLAAEPGGLAVLDPGRTLRLEIELEVWRTGRLGVDGTT